MNSQLQTLDNQIGYICNRTDKDNEVNDKREISSEYYSGSQTINKVRHQQGNK